MWPPAAARCKALRPFYIGGHTTTKFMSGNGGDLVLYEQDAVTVKLWTLVPLWGKELSISKGLQSIQETWTA